MRLIYLSILLFLATSSLSYAQPDLTEISKTIVYRINNPLGGGKFKEASGIMFEENGNTFLVTNAHVVTNEMGVVSDSIIIFENRVTPKGEILSGPNTNTIYISRNDKYYIFLAKDSTIDLALIPISIANCDINPEEHFRMMRTRTLPKELDIKLLKDSCTILTSIGFPSKDEPLRVRPQEIRWGELFEIENNIIKTNIPPILGNSGSPIFIKCTDGYHIIGIISGIGKLDNLTYAIPLNLLKMEFKNFFKEIDSLISQD